LPKGKEIEILKTLSKEEVISGEDAKNLFNKYNDELIRLEIYGLVDIERDKEVYRLKITSKGKFILRNLVF
jgi:hypothetical protein